MKNVIQHFVHMNTFCVTLLSLVNEHFATKLWLIPVSEYHLHTKT